MRTSSASRLIKVTGLRWKTASPEDALQAAKQPCNSEGDTCSGVVQSGSGDVALYNSLSFLKTLLPKEIGLNLQVTITDVKTSYEKVRATQRNITDTDMLGEGQGSLMVKLRASMAHIDNTLKARFRHIRLSILPSGAP